MNYQQVLQDVSKAFEAELSKLDSHYSINRSVDSVDMRLITVQKDGHLMGRFTADTLLGTVTIRPYSFARERAISAMMQQGLDDWTPDNWPSEERDQHNELIHILENVLHILNPKYVTVYWSDLFIPQLIGDKLPNAVQGTVKATGRDVETWFIGHGAFEVERQNLNGAYHAFRLRIIALVWLYIERGPEKKQVLTVEVKEWDNGTSDVKFLLPVPEYAFDIRKELAYCQKELAQVGAEFLKRFPHAQVQPTDSLGTDQPTRRVKRRKHDRQIEVKRLYADGYTAEETADKLSCGVATVKRDWKELGLRERTAKPK